MTTIHRTSEEKNINTAILLGSTIVIFVASFVVAYLLITLEIENFDNHLKTFRNTLIDREKFAFKTIADNLSRDISYDIDAQASGLRQKVKNQSLIAYNLAVSLYEQNADKTKGEIISIIKNAIQNISQSEQNIDYFIFDLRGRLLLNTKHHKDEGENFYDFLDINAQKFVQQIIDKSALEDSFVPYLWYEPNSSAILTKITHSKRIKQLDIVIGSGEFVPANRALLPGSLAKIKKQSFATNQFVFIYNISSLQNPKKSASLVLERNIQSSMKELDVVRQILIQTDYKANTFFEYDDKLLYAMYLSNLRSFIALGIDLKFINEIVQSETLLAHENLKKKIATLIFELLFVTLVFFLVSFFISKKIEKIFKNYRLKLFKNERKYELLFNHSNDGFIISELRADGSAKIISANSIARHISGYNDALMERDFFTFFGDFDKEQLLQKREIFARVLLQDRGGNIKNIELSCVIFGEAEQDLLFASLRDITERVHLKLEKDKQQQMLIQKSKMAAMGEMIGNIAHQWRQPLSQLSGLFFDIESAYDYNELDKKYLSSRIDEANDLVEHMSKTIDDFRNFFKPSIDALPFGLANTIQKSLKIIRPSLDVAGLEVAMNIDPTLHVRGLENEFSHVILNLVSNAKDIALQRQISQPAIAIFCELKDQNLLLHVEDNCGGIELDIIDKIFDPYFSTKYDYGTGIGLYMSKVIIENKMGGQILVSNTPRNGARFTISLSYTQDTVCSQA